MGVGLLVLVAVGVRLGLGVIDGVNVAVPVGVSVDVLVLLGLAVCVAVGLIVTGALQAVSMQTAQNNINNLVTRVLSGNEVQRCNGEE